MARYFQLLSLFLPTSLFVTVEVVKAVVAYLIASDWKLISAERAQTTQVRNMSILEDLGMLHYVFADKTGTLTCNKMEFHSMCIGKTIIGPKDNSDSPTKGGSLVFDIEKFEELI